MGRLTWRRTALVVLATAVSALALLAGTASAKKPLDRFHDVFRDSFSAEICGIPVDVQVRGTDNFFEYEDSFKDTSSVKQTLTNPENGKSIIIFNAGQVVGPPPIIDDEAGTITFVVSFKGLPEKIKTAHGPVLLRDVGIATFLDRFDLTTGEFISEDTIIRGPHPDLQSGFQLFCQVVTAALN
jgi:uncharacterized membrane protein YidH (DUF202 family)